MSEKTSKQTHRGFQESETRTHRELTGIEQKIREESENNFKVISNITSREPKDDIQKQQRKQTKSSEFDREPQENSKRTQGKIRQELKHNLERNDTKEIGRELTDNFADSPKQQGQVTKHKENLKGNFQEDPQRISKRLSKKTSREQREGFNEDWFWRG